MYKYLLEIILEKLLGKIGKIHTTEIGIDRIKHNLGLKTYNKLV